LFFLKDEVIRGVINFTKKDMLDNIARMRRNIVQMMC
jgi:hypothetical protein